MNGLGRGVIRLNGIELGYDSRMSLFNEFFHTMGTDDLRGTNCDSLKSVMMLDLLETHV